MTDLSAKFDALDTSLGGKLDTIILRLNDIKTELTSASGNIDAAPIVSAIEALRGTGPENTIRSLNQSIWNIAGPTPGKSLAEIYTLLVAHHAANAVYLSAIGADTDATATALGIPNGDATTTLLGVMYSLQYIIGHINQALGGIPYEDLTLTTVRGLISQLTTAVGQTNQLLDPIAYPPVDACETPYVSTGSVYNQAAFEIFPGVPLTYAGTIATWPTPPAGFGISRHQDTAQYYTKLNTTDWTGYRIYVASNAPSFGFSATAAQRLPTNQWLNLALNAGIFGNDMIFLVDGSEALKVYICQSADIVGGTAPTGTDFTSSSGTSIADGRRFVVWGDIDGITEGAGGVELTPASSWSGYEVYIQTSAPSARLHDVTNDALSVDISVNQWVALGSNHTLKWSVDAGYLVKGYIRVPSEQWMQFTTVPITSSWYQVNNWSPLPSRSDDTTICTRDCLNMRVVHVSGPRIRFMPMNSESVFLLLEPGMDTTISSQYLQWRTGSQANWDGHAPTTFKILLP